MPADREPPPQYTRYRARRRLLGEREEQPDTAGRPRVAIERGPRRGRGALPAARTGWRRWTTRRRIVLGLVSLVFGWLLLSLALFLISSHFNRTAPPADLAAALDPAGYPLTSANNILVLGS